MNILGEGPVKKKAKTSSTISVPAFLNKLYNLVSEPESMDVVAWKNDGMAFVIKDKPRFQNEILTKFFKHSNISSFIRQLNMYDFHKVSDGSDDNILTFANVNFLRGQPDLLYLIQRKKTGDNESVDFQSLLTEISSIKRHQSSISADLKNIQKDNINLWNESIAIRNQSEQQNVTVNRIVRFLASIFAKTPNSNTQTFIPNNFNNNRLLIQENNSLNSFPLFADNSDSNNLVLENDLFDDPNQKAFTLPQKRGLSSSQQHLEEVISSPAIDSSISSLTTSYPPFNSSKFKFAETDAINNNITELDNQVNGLTESLGLDLQAFLSNSADPDQQRAIIESLSANASREDQEAFAALLNRDLSNKTPEFGNSPQANLFEEYTTLSPPMYGSSGAEFDDLFDLDKIPDVL